MTPSTITAIATPLGSGGLGVVRLSGPRSAAIAATIFRRSGQQGAPQEHDPSDFNSLISHQMYHGWICDGDRFVDDVLLVIMRTPRSYTGEDVVEIHSHGGPLVLKTILALLLKQGAEPAGPGEFTRRAFINGKIDLTQAEAVADIIAATSSRALSAAVAQISGALKTEINKVRDEIMAVMAEIEVATNFGDQADGDQTSAELDGATLGGRLAETALSAIDDLINRHDAVSGSPDGPRVVLAGVPNVGKSTLLNRLARSDRAIVTSQPGTTRDIIESSAVLQGRFVVVVDTAGLRRTTDCEIEKEGMARARQALARADAVVFMVDAEAGVSEQDQAVFDLVKDKPLVIAANKMDVAETKPLVLPQQWLDTAPMVKLSAKTGAGMSTLETFLMAACCDAAEGLTGEAVPNTRHKSLLDNARAAVRSAINALQNGVPPDMASIDLRAALEALGAVVGDCVRPDVLDSIFERFCIGK